MTHDLKQITDQIKIDLIYPGIDGNASYIRIGLCHVRAADDIRVSYDFERDGWKIEQPLPLDDNGLPRWRESAFLPAWQYEKDKKP